MVASLAARRATGSSAAALNATSHFLWGERAAREDGYSMKYNGLHRQLRLPRAALACVYAALALGLSARDLIVSEHRASPRNRRPA